MNKSPGEGKRFGIKNWVISLAIASPTQIITRQALGFQYALLIGPKHLAQSQENKKNKGKWLKS